MKMERIANGKRVGTMTRRTALRLGAGLLAGGLAIGPRGMRRVAEADGEIKIAVVGPMSGEGAVFGEEFARGAGMAAQKINDGGGVEGKTITIVPFDDRNDLTETVNVAQKVASDSSIVASMGHFSSSAVHAAMPVYEANQLPLVVVSAADPAITRQGNEWLFRVSPTTDTWATTMADLIVTELGLTKLGAFYQNTDYGQADHQSFVERAEANGGAFLFAESYQPDAKDFTSALIELGQAELEAVYLSSYFNDAALIISQAKAAGIEARWFAPAPITAGPFLKVGGDAVEGTITIRVAQGDNWTAVAGAYQEEYGTRPSPLVIFAYSATQAIAEAIRLEDATRDGIRAGLEQIDNLDTALGPLTLDENRQAVYVDFEEFLIVQDGEFRPWNP